MKKKFFGWENFKWLIKELIATCSDKPSYFSQKRIKSWILFDAAIGSMMVWFCVHVHELNIYEICAFTGVLFGYAGYTVATIQKEKRNKNKHIDNQEVK